MTDDDLVRRLLVGACAQNDVAWSLMRAAADRIKALTAEHNATLARLAGAVAREIALTAERDRLALAICGGEDAPGYANAQTVETLEYALKQNRQSHWATINSLLAAEAERDRLREALEDIIADCEADYPPSHGAIKYAAKLALKGETP